MPMRRYARHRHLRAGGHGNESVDLYAEPGEIFLIPGWDAALVPGCEAEMQNGAETGTTNRLETRMNTRDSIFPLKKYRQKYRQIEK
jgi:hypothetical protein